MPSLTLGRIPLPLFPCVIDTQVQQWLESLDVPPVSNDSVLMLACPECGHTKDCINQQLLKGTAWKTVACRRCRNSRSSAKWKCVCGVPWYICTTHAPVGHSAARKPKDKGPTTSEPASIADGIVAPVSTLGRQLSNPAMPRPLKRSLTSVGHNPCPSYSQISYDNTSNQHGEQLERLCKRSHQAVRHDSSQKPRATKRKATPARSSSNKKSRDQCNAEAIAAVSRMRQTRLQQTDPGLGGI